MRPWCVPFFVAVVALGASACSSSNHEITISGVVAGPDSVALFVQLNSCHQHPEVIADETEAEVRLRATGDEDSGMDCAEGATICLNTPLGDRDVVDENTGERVRVAPPQPDPKLGPKTAEVPNLYGLPVRVARRNAVRAGFNVEIRGGDGGYVVLQDPEPGHVRYREEIVRLSLGRRGQRLALDDPC